MNISENTQAILLLNAPLLYCNKSQGVKPLSLKEYEFISDELKRCGYQPKDLLSDGSIQLLEKLKHIVSAQRLSELLGRGFLLAQCLDYWSSRGIWVISRADDAYPQIYKQRLRNKSPILIYGCGDKNILTQGGVAIVGSRDIGENVVAYTVSQINNLVKLSQNIISGGARGVDRVSMLSCLDSGGYSCGVLADSLAKSVLNAEYRKYIATGKLVLISAVDPDAGFNVGSAMARNKYIYALAHAGLVVNSDFAKGGTWAGAIEVLKEQPQFPLFVRENDLTNKAFMELCKLGAHLWATPKTKNDLNFLLNRQKHIVAGTKKAQDLFNSDEKKIINRARHNELKDNSIDVLAYQYFNELILNYLDEPKSKKDLQQTFSFISKNIFNQWVDSMLKEHIIEIIKIKRSMVFCKVKNTQNLFSSGVI